MIVYVENYMESTKKKTIICELSNVSRYKFNTQKSIACLHTNNEHMGTEIKNIIPFTMIPKKIKYLGIHLPKHVQGLYTKYYKMLMN